MSGEVGAYVERLIDTELSPGDRLPPERELAALLHVSRTSVREAMGELERRRRIERTPGRGTTVLPRPATSSELERDLVLTTAELADVAELRLVVEPQIAGLAATRATDADLVLLESTLADSHAGLTPASHWSWTCSSTCNSRQRRAIRCCSHSARSPAVGCTTYAPVRTAPVPGDAVPSNGIAGCTRPSVHEIRRLRHVP